MMATVGDTERRIICPYEPSHVLLHYRMQSHLVKCRRNHPDAKKGTCIYNSTHQVPEPELAYHHEICNDRGNLDKFMHSTEESNPDKYLLPQTNIEPSENWDDQPARPTYNPELYCQNNPILRNNVVQTQSQVVRRNFRMEERQRMQELLNQRTVCEPTNTGPEATGRRPMGASEGIQNRSEIVDVDPFDVSNLLAKVKQDSKTVTIPKVSRSRVQDENENGNEPEPEIQNSVPEDNAPPAISTGAIRRTNGYSNAASRTQHAAPNITGAWGANRNSRVAPVDPFAATEFPELGRPRPPMRPMSRGRGTRLSKN